MDFSHKEKKLKANILVLNDLHVGSPEGLLHPNYVDVDDSPRELNPGQNYLWDNFTDILAAIKEEHKIDLIVSNGDLIEGKQRKNDPAPLCLHRLEDQRNAATMILEEVRSLFPNPKWTFVYGTPYHENAEDVRAVARRFTDEKPKMTCRMKVGDTYISFHHEVSYSGGVSSRAGSMEREFVNALLQRGMGDECDFHAHIRSHCHYFAQMNIRGRLLLVTPCFQLQNSYAVKASPFKGLPSLGMVVLHVDDSLIARNQCPVGYTEYLFHHPSYEIDEPLLQEADEATA